MYTVTEDYVERVYAGWLGKVIGVRLGAPIESWTYDQIRNIHGEPRDYLVDYKDFATDDDTNGPMFFLRSLEDYTHTSELTAEQIGLTWLNYAPYEHGFYWWGGYGKSTEHTAYLNLRNGIMAPRSGSIAQNGAAIAEQIGGQIFIDVWGLVVPGNPKLAAAYAEKAASVSHDGNGKYGGMFIAACISAAFVERDILGIIEAGLSVIPADCEYTRMTRELIKHYESDASRDWREAYQFVKANFGYDRYPGTCHIIPNSAVIVLSLLYGQGDFSDTLNICNLCGWDTDCNVANVGTIMGVRGGLEGIDYDKWRKPINDFLAASSVIGSLNILDIPWCAAYIAKFGYKIAGQQPSGRYALLMEGRAADYHFELPGSTHGFRVAYDHDAPVEARLTNSQEYAYTGRSSLKVSVPHLFYAQSYRIYNKTYYRPKDLHDARYDPCFSPIVYPGQRISGSILLPEYAEVPVLGCLYVKDDNSGTFYESEKVRLVKGEWASLSFDIPSLEGACLTEAGFRVYPEGGWNQSAVVFIDEVSFGGQPDYTLDFSKERIEKWQILHNEVSQLTHLKGIWKLEDDELSGSCADFGEAYTGHYNWTDYRFETTIKPRLGAHHAVNFRVQGAIRSYAAALVDGGRLALLKNDNGYRELAKVDCPWTLGGSYRVRVEVVGARIRIWVGDELAIDYTDRDKPYVRGQIGVSIRGGSHCHYGNFVVKGLGEE